MRCKTCHYSLEGLTGPPHRCPECGTPFDPNDHSSVESVWPHLAVMIFRTVGSYVVMMLLYALLVGPDLRWTLEGREGDSLVSFAFVMFLAVAGSNFAAGRCGWPARLALLFAVWVIGGFLIPAIGRATCVL